MSFAKVYRPVKPAQLIGEGQVKIANALMKNLDEGKVTQELMFIGPSGIGKTTIAYMYCRKLLGLEPGDDLTDYIIEVNGSSDTGIDFIRQSIISSLNYAPLHNRKYSIFLIDEVHGLSIAAQNALLKDTENLPSHVVMILATTDPQKLIKTMKSRFTQYYLDSPNMLEFRKLAHWIILADKSFELDNQVRDEIIALSSGNVREFGRYLDRVKEGSYISFVEQSKDEGSLVHAIMYGKPVDQWFIAADKEKSPAGFSVGVTHYMASVARNPKSNQINMKRALKTMKIFGAKKVFSKEELYSSLAKLAEEMNLV